MIKRPNTNAQRLEAPQESARQDLRHARETSSECVPSSNANIYAQIIDDVNGRHPGLPLLRWTRNLKAPAATRKLPSKVGKL